MLHAIWAKIQIAFAALGGVLGYFLGGMDGMLITLIVFMAVDYLTGIMCAIAERKLSSEIGVKGICRKVIILALVGIAHMLDMHVIGNGTAVRSTIIFFYVSNEGVSLLENAARLGLPIPEKLKQVLAQLHGKDEEIGHKDE